ncbi:uncharacterized protein NECHADRAFT_87610 [Fusarium vanettenii 77-13-4]|uniref:Heterokaryon incompatibility domain-containing protein n=1 Tax=Fusarium vanettenii (strain ATCC MYA-4622 / CBS 123669 / FGSC 9596 / NRRL 45880 / 77-13-4) TaxID=660122 RepID=C7Z2I2_FUSV7|nr:uncharacterized protein NECHADRAFT_87610 [Fusarium vanettenii 77-13-4]EEU41666.1 hypothetical protein NECHADRAFT_87610 [Fusarium vanettenii 77-13-4]
MSGQRVTSVDTEGDLGEDARSSLQRLPEGSVETPSGNSLSTQGIFATPENDSFHQLYTYSDLDSTAQDIRLIHVFQDEHCDLIQCEFLPQSSLQEAIGSYHTLSYCAGDPLETETVLLQGIKFNVFANLKHALEKTLSVWKSKYPEEECVLWVDQICINQRSDAERSHQVGLMRDIYTNSRRTFISLSTADSSETSSNGMDWLKELAEAYQPSGEFPTREDQLRDILERNIPNSSFLEGWTSFYDLVQCPWWRRAWIHQEFICSPSVIFMYHDSTIFSAHTLSLSFLLFLRQTLQSSQITAYLDCLGRARPEETRLTNGDGNPLREVRERNTRALDSLKAIELLLNANESWKGDEDLKKVLARSRHCRSSDPRDRIFAFLGLAHPGYGIEADYSKSNTLDAAITHTAKKILGFDRHLEVLAFSVRVAKTRPNVLPSWVPDWASTEILEHGHFAPLPGLDKQFQNDAVGSLVIHTPTDDSNFVLQVQGLQIDTLDRNWLTWMERLSNWDFVTAQGYTVRCRPFARDGDELWILMGSKWPFILRPCDGGYMVVTTSQDPCLIQGAVQLSRFCNSLHQQSTTKWITTPQQQRNWFSGKILRCHSSNVGEPWVRFPDYALAALYEAW